MGESRPLYVTGLYSRSRGQSRWDTPVLFRDVALASRVQARLVALGRFDYVRATSLSGRVLVGHPPELPLTEVRALLERTIHEAVEQPARAAPPSPASPPTSPDVLAWEGAELVGFSPGYRLAGAVGLGAAGVSSVRDALTLFPSTAVWTGVGAFSVSSLVLLRMLRERGRHVDREALRTLPQLIVALRPYRRRLALALAHAVGSRALYVLQMAVVGLGIDRSIAPEKAKFFRWQASDVPLKQTWIAAAVVVIAAGSSYLDFNGRTLWMGEAHKLMHDLRMQLLEHVMRLPMSELDETNRGSFMALIGEDINRLELLFDTLWEAFSDLSGTLTTAAGFFLVSPAFAGLVAVPVPLILALGVWLQGQLGPRYQAVRENAAVLGGTLSSALDGVSTARSFNAEAAVTSWVGLESTAFLDRQHSAVRLSSAYVPVLKAFATATRSLVVLAAGSLVEKRQVTPGHYVMMTLLSTHVTLPLLTIGSHLGIIQGALASLHRVFDSLRLPVEDASAGRPLPARATRGDIRFEGVSFRYAGGPAVLRSLDLSIPAGRTTAVVGATGSGKSTIAKLLLRFYEAESGRVLLGVEDLEEIRPLDLRRAIGYVSQDVFLFDATLRDNLALARADAPEEAVVRAARVAGAHEFIAGLPEGYRTRAGERGQKLSGGERQRVGIARALVADRPIVILDEATSALDSETESELMESLTRALRGRTVLIIAHRLSAVRQADKICVLDDGRIVEEGRHDELIARQGRYAEYWRLQTQ